MSENVGRFFGLSLEEEFGDLPENPNWFWSEFGSADISPPDTQYGTYEGATSRTPIYATPANYMCSGPVALPADIINIGWVLLGILGEVESEYQGDGIWKHTFTIADRLPTFTFAVGKELYQHNYTGITLDSLSMEYDDNFVVLGLDVIGGKDEKDDDPATVGVCDLPESILTSLMSTFERGGSDITPDIEEFELEINNNIEVDDNIPAAERYPKIAFPQQLEITINMDISFSDLETLEAFWGGANGPTIEVEEEAILIEFVQEEGAKEITIKLPAAIAQSYSNPISGRDKIEQSISYQAIVDKEECSAAIVELINNQAFYNIVELAEYTGTLDVDGETADFNVEVESETTLNEIVLTDGMEEDCTFDAGTITLTLEDKNYNAEMVESMIADEEIMYATVTGGQEATRAEWLGTVSLTEVGGSE